MTRLPTTPLRQEDVRAALLAAQGLPTALSTPATKADALAAIRRMHLLQIDTIHVVARSPYLVLWSRVGAYEPRWLDELLAEGKLFEYWAHAACFLPIEDYPLYRSKMLNDHSSALRWSARWLAEHHTLAGDLLAHIRANGPVRSADFKRANGRGAGWWDWKEEKEGLEALFTAGELMIARRHNFQRVYDLRERVLPGWDDAQALTPAAAEREWALRAVQALGVAKPEWVATYFYRPKSQSVKVLKELVAAGALDQVAVAGWRTPGLVHPANRALVAAIAEGAQPVALPTLLSPFDPVVFDRARALDLFGFDYRIECYTPAHKRQYGYFTLPILYQNGLIGRLDAKAHRQAKLFEVRALHLEPGVALDDELLDALAATLRRCAGWHSTPDVVVRQAEPPELAELVNRRMAAH
ncbi:MAG TPA: crosslink repair DNA glycosylase YcaQ family protein [Caldilineaceae bacterium]|nr:crosslink repair DNA glycosylase YcaQ family protein [Caldilineaceae bacterium]